MHTSRPRRSRVFGEREDAEEYLAQVNDDLAEMTKTQFEDAYLANDSPNA